MKIRVNAQLKTMRSMALTESQCRSLSTEVKGCTVLDEPQIVN